MPFNTVTVCVAVAPTVVSTWFSHYLHRRSLHQKPIRDISYHEGLHIIRKFMYYASHHTVEDIQAFTSQSVATPHWVKAVEVKIGEDYLDSSADKLITQLGPKGIARVGGIKWWQWRGGSSLKAEWIQMRRDYQERKNDNSRCKRVILYIHGGAYFFGSVDASRYQMQRHARKLGGRVFAPRYRLAPQFPFPCGLQDCIAAYLFLLSVQEPTEIILSGDSAGAGMVLTMLVVLRDQGLPLPAGAVLLSPWVDLLHSFPSMGSDGKRDFLPLHGFMQRPSLSWPPPNADELDAILKNAKRRPDSIPDSPSIAMPDTSRDLQTAIQGFSVHEQDNPQLSRVQDNNMSRSLPSVREHLSIVINGKIVEIKDQVQMYTTNDLLNHPLVSPIFQPSLGGLPPLLVMTGGGELLRDEQIYIAHKAANPPAYPPSEDTLNKHDPYREIITKYQPTYVQLQIWDDLCHVAPTLSFTKPAKHMFRSIAQFSAWALARAQDSDIDIPNGEEEVEESTDSTNGMPTKQPGNIPGPAFRTCVGKAGDPLPPFRRHMIRQRVDRNGKIYPLPDESLFPSLNIPPSKIGAVNAVPLRRWMSAKQLWDTKYSSEKLRAQEKRIHELIYGVAHYEPGELPPPSSLAARKGAYIRRVEERQRKSRAMTIWSRWGAKDDIKALARDARGLFPGVSNEKVPRPAGAAGAPAGPAKPVPQTATPNVGARPRVTSGTRTVSDRGQATDDSVPFDRQGSSSRRDPDRFDFTLTTPTQTSDEHIYSTEPDSNNTNHGSRMDYVLSGGIVNDIVNEKRKSLSANANTEGASAASVRNAEGVISPVPGRAAALAPELEPEPASDASSAKFDWRTPNEFAALTPQDTPSIYSQDTNNNEAPAFRSISAARGRVSGKGKKAAATGATPPPPSTRVANNSSAGYFKFKPKKMLYDFDSANNLAPSDTEPFPPFPTTSNSSRNPSIGSRPSYRQGASGFRSWGRA